MSKKHEIKSLLIGLGAQNGERTYCVHFINDEGLSLFVMKDFPANKKFYLFGRIYKILHGDDIPQCHTVEAIIREPVFSLCEMPSDYNDVFIHHYNDGGSIITIDLDGFRKSE